MHENGSLGNPAIGSWFIRSDLIEVKCMLLPSGHLCSWKTTSETRSPP